jgi:osmotically-inducible protein OsmY
MKNNEELQQDVQDAIKWQPLLNAGQIGVTANDGVITLTGIVDSYAKKLEAEDAAKSVAGVKAVVEKLQIKFSSMYEKKDDNDIATEALKALKSNWRVPQDKVKLKVEGGWITLDGQLAWNYEKEAAKDAVKDLAGVSGVSNNIKIKSESRDAIEKVDIESALRRNSAINDDNISVDVSGTKVTLTGTVTSWYQRDEAEKIAWNAPGVWSVDNELVVEYDYHLTESL